MSAVKSMKGGLGIFYPLLELVPGVDHKRGGGGGRDGTCYQTRANIIGIIAGGGGGEVGGGMWT
jgi:hypothetical protein